MKLLFSKAMKVHSSDEAQETLIELNKTLDQMLAHKSLMDFTKDDLDEISCQVNDLIEEYYDVCDIECIMACRRLCLAYREIGCHNESVLYGYVSLTFVEDEFDDFYQNAVEEAALPENQESKLALKAFDAFLEQFIKLGSHYEPDEDEMETLNIIADALEDLDLDESLDDVDSDERRFLIDLLVRELNVNLAILIHDLYNEEVRKRYIAVGLDLSLQIAEAPEVLNWIDRKMTHNHLFQILNMESNLDDNDRDFINEAYIKTY